MGLMMKPKVCQTPGAIFHTKIGPQVVSCKVDIPFDLGLDKAEAIILTDKIHDALEGVLKKYFTK